MKRKTTHIRGLIEMKREFNRIKVHPKVHWTLRFYACELIRCFFFPLSPSDRSTPWRRWCWPLETQVRNTTYSLSFSLFLSLKDRCCRCGNSFLFCSFCISTVQHAFPSSVLLGSGWHHVSDHQHAGVLTHWCFYGNLCCHTLMIFFFCPLSPVSGLGWSHLLVSLVTVLLYCTG